MKVYIINDTYDCHFGSKAVMDHIFDCLSTHEIVYSTRTKERVLNEDAWKLADVILANGEGSIHHRSDEGFWIMKTLDRAQKEGKITFLVNSVFQEAYPYFENVLLNLDLFTVRETMSHKCAVFHGVNPIVLLDCCVSRSPKVNARPRITGITYGETHGDTKYSNFFDHERFKTFGQIKIDFDFSEFIYVLQGVDLYITGQHHGVYAAGLAGIPFIAIPSNSHKIEGIREWSNFNFPILENILDLDSKIEEAFRLKNHYRRFQTFLRNNPTFTRFTFDSAVQRAIKKGKQYKFVETE